MDGSAEVSHCWRGSCPKGGKEQGLSSTWQEGNSSLRDYGKTQVCARAAADLAQNNQDRELECPIDKALKEGGLVNLTIISGQPSLCPQGG